ncbi:MAG: diguanylate cyclase [Actinobacteria bacterium]|nr:diguanylate cyclase [Actinomycetota bacterium]MCG2807604.1 diguanylate cyclase [Coriobacteriia bacterium]
MKAEGTDRAIQAAADLAQAVSRPREFLITSDKESCRECWGCVRYCPARAIRVVHGRSEVIEERCVKCGACVAECGNTAHGVRDDTPAVTALLASGRPVVAVLASEFIAAMHPMSSQEVERSLESIGFFGVESTCLGEEMVALEYERNHSRPCASLTLRSTCPVVVDWVSRFHPSLASTLSPIIPPYVAQARLVKQLYPTDTAVVYVSPCYARKDEAYDPQFEGAVDAAIDFGELEKILHQALPRPPYASSSGVRRPALIKEISLTDGFPRRSISARNGTDTSLVKVRGLRALDELLTAVARGETGPAVIDALNCEGCIDGPAVRPGMSVFAKRNVIAAESCMQVAARVSTRELLGHLPSVELLRSFKARPVLRLAPKPERIDEMLREGEFATRADVLDCGACGYPTCEEHAIAIIRGDSSWDMCFPLQRRRMKATAEQMERNATTDALTGLSNRRAFDARLAEECARVERYGGQVSLLMIDIDGFKSVNDTAGHQAGDEVLRLVGALFKTGVRETDLASRYGGDEFAIILTGTGKTAAYAVAEKMRLAVADVRLDEGGLDALRVTASFGLASLGPSAKCSIELIEAADKALYQAKREGRNQVRIALG